jgi:hypothetical protein
MVKENLPDASSNVDKHCLSHCRAFLQLPLGERRCILSEQAEAMALHYKQDTEWQELQTGDLIDY